LNSKELQMHYFWASSAHAPKSTPRAGSQNLALSALQRLYLCPIGYPMSETKQKTIVWAVLLSEASHIFCCVLPTLFSLMSLMAGAGVISVMPGFIVHMHDFMHDYEVPMIIVSALILALGWGLYFYSKKVDCHDTGCGHGPCKPKKDKVRLLLIAATVLFLVNVSVYMLFHRTAEVAAEGYNVHDEHAHGDHH
jgi:hypothetical protein